MAEGLDFDLPFAEAVRRACDARLAAAIAGVGDVNVPIDERVHKARQATKDIRALLRLVRPALPAFRPAHDAMRDAARLLAHMRDISVRRASLNWLIKKHYLTGYTPALVLLDHHLAQARPAADDEARRIDLFAKAIAAAAGNDALWQIGPGDWTDIAEGATFTHRAARRAMRRAEKYGHPEHFHAWRKQVKHHAVHLALLQPLLDSAGPPADETLVELGNRLGRHHDLQALLAYVEAEPGLAETLAPVLRDAIHRAHKKLGRDAFRLGRRCLAARPADLRRRIEKALRRRQKADPPASNADSPR